MKLLLHTCCGPCFLGVWEELGTHSDAETTLYYFNPNIYPEEEYAKRLDNLRKAAGAKKVELIETDWKNDCYEAAVSAGNTDLPVRCLGCYRLRLTETAKYAKKEGFDAFSTTLLVSPYQQHEELKKIGEEVGAAVGIDFYYTDWRPHFREGQNEAKNLELYKQRYCGCKFSLAESNITS